MASIRDIGRTIRRPLAMQLRCLQRIEQDLQLVDQPAILQGQEGPRFGRVYDKAHDVTT